MSKKLTMEGGVEAVAVGVQADLRAKHIAFVLQLNHSTGANLGMVELSVQSQAQPATDQNEAIPGFDSYLAASPVAQRCQLAMRELALELAGYSKMLRVVEEPEPVLPVV